MLNICMALVSLAVAFIFMLAAREAIAAGATIPSTKAANQSAVKRTEIMDCFSLPSRYSLRTEYLKGTDLWISYTEDGPTGVDGGFIGLMSAYRTCSR